MVLFWTAVIIILALVAMVRLLIDRHLLSAIILVLISLSMLATYLLIRSNSIFEVVGERSL